MSIGGQQHYLWCAVDQDGDVLDILVQLRRNRAVDERFFRRVLAGQRQEPRRTVTDRLSNHGPSIRTVLPTTLHDTSKYAKNRAESLNQHTRRWERHMQGFKSDCQAQRFRGSFRYGRRLMSANNHRLVRGRAFAVWSVVTYAERSTRKSSCVYIA